MIRDRIETVMSQYSEDDSMDSSYMSVIQSLEENDMAVVETQLVTDSEPRKRKRSHLMSWEEKIQQK